MAGGALRHNAAAFTLATRRGHVVASVPRQPGQLGDRACRQGCCCGGDFTSVGGEYRKGLAAIDLTTGQVDPAFVTTVDGMVLDIDLSADGTRLFFGGTFKTAARRDPQRLASVNSRHRAPSTPASSPRSTRTSAPSRSAATRSTSAGSSPR